MKNFINKFTTLLLLIVVVCSCNNNVLFDDNSTIKKKQWNIADKKVFTVDVGKKDIVYSYRFAVNLRNTTDYKYNNIYFFITTIYPDGSVTRKDTVACVLSNPDGTWKGKGNADIRDNRFWFAQNVKFPLAGKYVFKIEQATKDTVLSGIKDVGLHIERQPL